MVQCGCGASVPDEDGPRHPYLTTEPGCWRRFGELQVRLLDHGSRPSVVVDAFAAQHAGNAEHERRQRQSVAIHLVALCLAVEHGVHDEDLHRLRGRTSARVLPLLDIDEWPALTPPNSWGPLNAASLLALPVDRLGDVVRGWPSQVWCGWAAYHDVVRTWAALLLAGDRT